MTDPSTILKLDRDRREAQLRLDVPALDALIADESMWIFGDAQANTKEFVLGMIGDTSGKTKLLVLDSADETVRFYGGVSVFSALAHVKTETSGEVSDFQVRYTIVWAPVGGDWKAVHYHATIVPEAA